MARIYIGLGSNVERERHLLAGIADLQQTFSAVRLSTVYESAAVGFAGANFFNLVAEAQTEMTLEQVLVALRRIEVAHGRAPDARKFSPRTLDLDLLCFDDRVCSEPVVLPRAEILHNAFVLCPFAELAPDWIHPVAGLCLSSLWRQYDKSRQPLTAVTLVASGCEFGQ